MTHPLIARLATNRAVTRLAAHVLPQCDLLIHRLTRGRMLPSRLFLDTIVLGTTGHRTGAPRATPLSAHRAEDGTWTVVGSNFGRPDHPVWCVPAGAQLRPGAPASARRRDSRRTAAETPRVSVDTSTRPTPSAPAAGRQPDHPCGLLGVGEHGRARDEPPDVAARHRVGDDVDVASATSRWRLTRRPLPCCSR
ncbi:nitroreductase/quinone reductase family protein [Streptomyces scabichelini]|uniref:nitroreductase/quinone reductase family protein n=1 Tax=Streptomyces scabichelini TaxID=2711217 RepID=UPI0019D0AAA5|nr:nitroreductase/quinone reductase family protein [Streptomyces scabichelini]